MKGFTQKRQPQARHLPESPAIRVCPWGPAKFKHSTTSKACNNIQLGQGVQGGLGCSAQLVLRPYFDCRGMLFGVASVMRPVVAPHRSSEHRRSCSRPPSGSWAHSAAVAGRCKNTNNIQRGFRRAKFHIQRRLYGKARRSCHASYATQALIFVKIFLNF